MSRSRVFQVSKLLSVHARGLLGESHPILTSATVRLGDGVEYCFWEIEASSAPLTLAHGYGDGRGNGGARSISGGVQQLLANGDGIGDGGVTLEYEAADKEIWSPYLDGRIFG